MVLLCFDVSELTIGFLTRLFCVYLVRLSSVARCTRRANPPHRRAEEKPEKGVSGISRPWAAMKAAARCSAGTGTPLEAFFRLFSAAPFCFRLLLLRRFGHMAAVQPVTGLHLGHRAGLGEYVVYAHPGQRRMGRICRQHL